MVRSVHEVVKYSKMHIMYNDLMSEKLRYPVNLRSTISGKPLIPELPNIATYTLYGLRSRPDCCGFGR